MSEQNDRIAYLLDVYTSKKATAQEEQELVEWMHEASEDDELRNHAQLLWEQYKPGVDFSYVNWEQMFNRTIQSQKVFSIAPLPKRSAQLRLRIAVAASFIIAVSIATYFVFFNKTQPSADLAEHKVPGDVKAPETNKAMITLEDGSIVYLDNVGNGQLALQGNIKLVKLGNGQIAYETVNGERITEMKYNTLSNPRGSKVIDMILSDGSHVWLNAGSSLTFPIAFIGNQRTVSITGEAYFEVAHDDNKLFKVTKGNMEVTVLGTHFNVNAYEDESSVNVTLLEGAVNVSNGKIKEQLKPGQQAQMGNTFEVLNDVDLNSTMAWKNGLFSFKATSLEEMMRQLARWYDVTVKYEGEIPNRSFGGKIHRDANISEVLKILEESKVNYRINNKEIIILP